MKLPHAVYEVIISGRNAWYSWQRLSQATRERVQVKENIVRRQIIDGGGYLEVLFPWLSPIRFLPKR